MALEARPLAARPAVAPLQVPYGANEVVADDEAAAKAPDAASKVQDALVVALGNAPAVSATQLNSIQIREAKRSDGTNAYSQRTITRKRMREPSDSR